MTTVKLFGAQPPRRRPVAYSLGGGGFRAMSDSIGVTNAMMRAPGGSLLNRVTHLGSNSGGGWFTAQLVLGKQFFQELEQTESTSIDGFITSWGEACAPTQSTARVHRTPPHTHALCPHPM